MENAGVLLLGSALAGILLGVGITLRQPPFRLGTALFFSLVMTLLTAMTVMTAASLIGTVHAHMTHPEYTAVIVDYESYWSEDDDGDQTLMHRPTLRFTDNSGTVITRPSQSSSSWRPTIGDTRSVRYQDGKMHEPSVLLYVILGLFATVCGFFVLVATAYVLGFSTKKLSTAGVLFLLYGIVPAGLGGMAFALNWAVYDFLFGSNRADIDWSGAIFIAIFGTLITLFLVAYVWFVLFAPTRAQK